MRIVVRHLREVIDLTGNKPVVQLLTKRQYRAKYGSDAYKRTDVVLNQTNGITEAVALENGVEIAKGVARCGYGQTFNRKEGTGWAVERLGTKLSELNLPSVMTARKLTELTQKSTS